MKTFSHILKGLVLVAASVGVFLTTLNFLSPHITAHDVFILIVNALWALLKSIVILIAPAVFLWFAYLQFKCAYYVKKYGNKDGRVYEAPYSYETKSRTQ